MDIDIGPGDLIHKATFADIRITADEQCTGVGIDCWQSGDMLSDLLEIGQWFLLPPHDSRHPPQRRTLELFATIQRVTKLDKTNIVFGDLGDEVATGVELAESDLIVILVVKDIEQGGQERVKVLPESQGSAETTPITAMFPGLSSSVLYPHASNSSL